MPTTDPAAPGDEVDRVLTFSFLDRWYTIRPDEITTKLTTECRATTGLTPAFVFQAFNRYDFDLDIVSAAIWLARRMAGERAVTQIGRKSLTLWDEITAQVSYKELQSFDVAEGEEPADPETPAGS